MLSSRGIWSHRSIISYAIFKLSTAYSFLQVDNSLYFHTVIESRFFMTSQTTHWLTLNKAKKRGAE